MYCITVLAVCRSRWDGEIDLSAASRVLGRAAGDQLRVVVLQEVLVEVHVLGFGQDGVVGLEAVFLEQGIVSVG